jgi:hypothetical protein
VSTTTHRSVRLELVAVIDDKDATLCSERCVGYAVDPDADPVCNFFGRYLAGSAGSRKRAEPCISAERGSR